MTIFKNSIITLGLAVFAFTSIFIISVLVFMNHLYYEINAVSLGNTAKTLMTAIGKDNLAKVFSQSGEDADLYSLSFNVSEVYRVTLIDQSGYVLWDSHVADRLVNHNDREEIIAALEGREGSSRRESISTGMRRIYYALPVYGDNDVIGVFRLSLTIPEFNSRISPVILPFIIFICLFIIAAFWAVIMYSRSLASSLGRLVSIAQSSAQLLSGADGIKAIDHVSPEFISLEKAMRAMAKELNLRIEHAVSESSRLQAILNGMSEAVFAMDQNLKLHLVNPKARELFGLGSRDVKDMTLLEATHSAELVETAIKAISCGSSFETELTFYKGAGFPAGGEAPRLVQYFHVYASHLSAGGAVLVLQEVTRLVKLERVRKDFIANVSHELRTPIQLIKGFSETLLDAASDPGEGNKEQIIHFLEIILKNAGIMENLTNDLLTLADLENSYGEDKLSTNSRMEDQNIAQLVNEAVSSMELKAKSKQIEIIVNCPQDLSVKLFGSYIIQALINLIDNGIKYSPAGTKIWVNVCLAVCKDSDQIQSGEESGEVVFEVCDKGIGISSEHLERIFERFYRVDTGRKREAGGTGLGLSIVRHIALIHKGRAEAESRAGEGSIFRIIIPNHSNHSSYKDHRN